jgi:hypothetical protein
MKGIIDRFEGDMVVVEIEGKTQDFPKSLFPKEIEVGDVVKLNGNKITIQKDETDKLRKEIADLMAEVWEED